MLPLRELSDDFIFLFQLFPEICHLLHHLLHLLNFAVIFAGLQTLWCYLAIIQLQKTLEFQQLCFDRGAVVRHVFENKRV